MKSIKISILNNNHVKCLTSNKIKNYSVLNYNNLKPIKGGLFCGNIYGFNSFKCKCGKILTKKGSILYCNICKISLIDNDYKNSMNAYIDLEESYINPLFCKSNYYYISILLNISKKNIKNILYNNYYIVFYPNNYKYKVICKNEYIKLLHKIDFIGFTGHAGLNYILNNLDIVGEIKNLNLYFSDNKNINNLDYKKKLIKYKLLINFKKFGYFNKFFIQNLFVLNPNFRPILKLENNQLIYSDFNELYKRLIYRKLRYKYLKINTKSELLINRENFIIQKSIDDLFIENKNLKNPMKSISSLIKGKLGLFRHNLLGKRVDFSARSVIVSGPDLNIDECYIPESIAIELFKPFIYNKLINLGFSFYKSKSIINNKSKLLFKVLKVIVKNQLVLLNRAPTLHRLGIQSFKIILTKEKAIRIHPLVCTAFNADFDGDQMAVHIALSKESLAEYKLLMNFSKNIINPSNGNYFVLPTQDILLGLFYSSILNKKYNKFFIFFSILEVKYAYNYNIINLNTRIFVKIKEYYNNKFYETTLGRILVYNIFPNFNFFNYINKLFKKKNLNDLFKLIAFKYEKDIITSFSNNLMKLGFYFSTISGISICIDDMGDIKNKNFLVNNSKKIVKVYNNDYLNGLLSNKSRKKKIIDLWQITIDLISESCIKNLFYNSFYKKNYKKNNNNTLSIIMDSEARGSETQIKQICGVRGLIFYKNQGILDLPVLNNLKEGLNSLEYYFFSYSSRKVLSDTSLKTSTAGYLTRKLVESSIDLVINQYDCFTEEGINFKNLLNKSEFIESIFDRIYGRTLLNDLILDNNLVIKKNKLLLENEINILKLNNIDFIKIRSPITCKLSNGLCQLCYGLDLSKNKLVLLGESVGIIAAQAIGEPGTQLTMRTFHSGGAFNYKKKINRYISNNEGYIYFSKSLKFIKRKNYLIVISSIGKIHIKNKLNEILETYDIPYSSKLYVNNNTYIKKKKLICKWDLDDNYIISKFNGKIILKNFIENYNYIKIFDKYNNRYYYKILDFKNNKAPFIKIFRKNKKFKIIKLLSDYIVLFKNNSYIKKGYKIIKFSKNLIDSIDDMSNITGGLPKIISLFEARCPKKKIFLAYHDGVIIIKKNFLYIKNLKIKTKYNILNKSLLVKNGSKVCKGDKLVEGLNYDPNDILKLYNLNGIFDYYTSEIKIIYNSQGVTINDKHIEIILKQMLKKVVVTDPGRSNYIKGDIVEKSNIENLNKIFNRNILFEQILIGVTKTSMSTNSFLAEISFQKTNLGLTKSSIFSRENKLINIKENTMLGKLIPIGTGFYNIYNDYKSKNKIW